MFGQCIDLKIGLDFEWFFFLELSLSQIIGEFGPSRDPEILEVKCRNLQVIIEKVHR